MTGASARRRMPPRGYLAVIRTIDKFTELTGYVFVVVIIPLILANVVEVFARYMLRSPTWWPSSSALGGHSRANRCIRERKSIPRLVGSSLVTSADTRVPIKTRRAGCFCPRSPKSRTTAPTIRPRIWTGRTTLLVSHVVPTPA